MITSTINSITKPHRTRGESKYMLEEIYLSDVCIDMSSNQTPNDLLNPQNAYYNNGRYYFQMPAMWFNSTCNNKAIGLRSIKLMPEQVRFIIRIDIYNDDEPNKSLYNFNVIGQYLPNTSIMEIMSDISSQVTNILRNEVAKTIEDFKLASLLWIYNTTTNYAAFKLDMKDSLEDYILQISEEYTTSDNNTFAKTFNCNLPIKGLELDFPNVWDRQSLFVHASFVNGTSFQLLGQSDEFYTKPSKMYKFNGNSSDMWFSLSFDGMRPQNFKFARFIIQLAYIYNDADYMAE